MESNSMPSVQIRHNCSVYQGTSDAFDRRQGAQPLNGEVAALLGVVAEYLRRCANPVTRDQNRQRLGDLFRSCGRTDPATVTEGDLSTLSRSCMP
jgi:hypothetical protein